MPKSDDGPRFSSDRPPIKERLFRERGDNRYSLECLPLGLTFEVDRLRRSSQELWGELTVTVNGAFPTAKSTGGVISVGDLNFSSVPAREKRAKLLSDRADAHDLDWFGLLEEFAVQTIAAERHGKPAQVLADLPDTSADKPATVEIGGFPILRELPLVLFGDSGAMKSYFVMWVAGLLAEQGVAVLYADWEFAASEHRHRLGRIFDPMPKNLHYVRCDKPLVNEHERLQRLVREHKCRYVICDSVGFAVNTALESDGAIAYFQGLRQLGIGSLNIAHIPKQTDDSRQAEVFGSIFFRHGARSVWFMQRASGKPGDPIAIGLYNRKNNVGALFEPRAYRFHFDPKRTRIEAFNIQENDELASGLPLLDRMKRLLHKHDAALTAKQLSEDLNVSISAIRGTYAKHQTHFEKIGNKIRLAPEGLEF